MLSRGLGKQLSFTSRCIKDQFHNQNFAEQAVTARTHEFDSQFNPVISKQMDKYSKKNATDNLTVLQGQVKEVQGVMSQNIEAVIQRGERLDDLMDKTDELEAAVVGNISKKQQQRSKKKSGGKNLKMKIIVGLVGVCCFYGNSATIVFGSGVLKK
ncbi:vesicle-associated membrane protein 8-like [Mercenaria mercenaria]|uniref:vesicle-associated membrane protein 8-like n=1 Tax=Mercenaria mercenaria TaxID=6596 RepID=UPI00234F67AD|nr:vesicle-associated membrane protein 8-like [Mercenaria mercenaria]